MVSPAIRGICPWAFLLALLAATGGAVGSAQADPSDTLDIAALGDSISGDAVSADSIQAGAPVDSARVTLDPASADSIQGAPPADSMRAGAPPPQTYLISLDHDVQLSVVRIEPRTWDYVRAYGADGHTSDIAAHRIRSIRGSDGRDWTRDVVDRGKTIGKAPIVPIQRHGFTFLGHPYPHTRIFTVLQIGALGILGNGHDDGIMTFDLGVMGNIDEHWALGVIFHTEGDEASDSGFLVRGRRWLGETMSIDLATGFVQHDPWPPLETSWVNQAQLNFGNLASFTVEMETWKLNEKDLSQSGYYVMQAGSGTNWYVGGSLNYLPGVVAFLALGILVLASYED